MKDKTRLKQSQKHQLVSGTHALLKFKSNSTGKEKPVACCPGAISHSSAFVRNLNNIKPFLVYQDSILYQNK